MCDRHDHPTADLDATDAAASGSRLDASAQNAAQSRRRHPGYARTCDECGASFVAKRAHGRFCSTACRKAFNNRAAVRGADLYHLMMSQRFERDAANAEKVWQAVNRMCASFRDEDFRERDGRISWDAPKEVIARNMHRVRVEIVEGQRPGAGRRTTVQRNRRSLQPATA